ncbi:hypothetical protein PUNSTDRAFT_102596, partial [Punctularia strigosozonata HHB-11173 SS5]|uniref:uncharacterized protein n=1 Tax=Punctularia strigosozonata (strain HHB-11173) TaxID=741275 RepID=UPI0004417F17
MAKGKKRSKHPQVAAANPAQKAFPTHAQQEAFSVRICNLGGDWPEVVMAALSESFGIPPLTTRKGLKQVHVNFDALCDRLDAAYAMYEEEGNVMVLGGIVRIYSKMCADGILRDKLFERGLMQKLMPLLDSDLCRFVALRSLVTMTRYGNRPVRREIARTVTRRLLRLVDERPNDRRTEEMCIGILSACISIAVHDPNNPPDAETMRDICITETLDKAVRAAKRPGCSPWLIGKVLALFQNAGCNCSEDLRRNPSAINLVIAFLRSDDLETRCFVVSSLLLVHFCAHERDRLEYDVSKLRHTLDTWDWPPYILGAMAEFGRERCDTSVQYNTALDIDRAKWDLVETGNLCRFGKTIARCMLRSECPITPGKFELYGRGPDFPPSFQLTTGVLLLAADAMDQTGSRDEAHYPVILRLKTLLVCRMYDEACSQAQAAAARDPDVAYYYYVASISSKRDVGLRYAKKGLRCTKTLTLNVKLELLRQCVEHAGALALAAFQAHDVKRDTRREEGVAFLVSALGDARTFMAEAPPDAMAMKAIANWYILLFLAIKGKEVRTDLRDVADALEKIRINEGVAEWLGARVPNTQQRLARMMVVEGYAVANEEWGSAVKRSDDAPLDVSDEPFQLLDPGKAMSDLAAWLDDGPLVSSDEEESTSSADRPAQVRLAPRRVTIDSVSLYLCSFCENPSAALKKCGGCGKTRYCDAACQKGHWKAHKPLCQRSS